LSIQIEARGLKTPDALHIHNTMKTINLKGYQVECTINKCGKLIQGQTESEVLHNLKIHQMKHISEEVKLE
jgi:hypothetical protein